MCIYNIHIHVPFFPSFSFSLFPYLFPTLSRLPSFLSHSLSVSSPLPLSLSLSLRQSSVSEKRPSCVKDQLSLTTSSLFLRTHYSGEVAGMMATTSLMTGAHPGNEGEESAAKLAAVFTAQLRDALRDGMGVWDLGYEVWECDISHAGSRDRIVTSLYRCTALLLHTIPSPPPLPSTPPPLSPLLRSLLSTITRLPVRTFTEVAIATAVQCWQWLLTAGPILEFPVSCLQCCLLNYLSHAIYFLYF